jgi:hypothetical protein
MMKKKTEPFPQTLPLPTNLGREEKKNSTRKRIKLHHLR